MPRYTNHYQLDAKQIEEARANLTRAEEGAEAGFRDPEFIDKIAKYKGDLARIDRILNSPTSLKYERERAYKERREVESARRELLAKVDSWTKALHDTWTPKGAADKVGPPPALWTKLDWINALTMIGMLAVGICLMLGLFTPLAALGGVFYLTLFYLSMPPWPGVPASPMSEGHYLFVNKNLIELLACLAIASTPNGLWIGLDAIFFGGWARRRAARAEERATERGQDGDGSNGSIPEPPRSTRPAPARPAKTR